MSIGFFPRYSQLGASSRCRFYMYFQHWLKSEPQADIAIFDGFSDDYLRKLYANGSVSKTVQLREFLRMLFRALRLPEKLIIATKQPPFLSNLSKAKMLLLHSSAVIQLNPFQLSSISYN